MFWEDGMEGRTGNTWGNKAGVGTPGTGREFEVGSAGERGGSGGAVWEGQGRKSGAMDE